MNSYWENILKREINTKKIFKLTSKILNNYFRFNSNYHAMKKCGGNIFEIEFISWKMHSDILKFEIESEDKVE